LKTHFFFDDLSAEIVFLHVAGEAEVVEDVHALVRLDLFGGEDQERVKVIITYFVLIIYCCDKSTFNTLFLLFFTFFLLSELCINLIPNIFILLRILSDASCLYLKLLHSQQVLSRLIIMLKMTLFLHRLIEQSAAKENGATIDG
jgi:hypothetical protein